jgi:hypothetical protein
MPADRPRDLPLPRCTCLPIPRHRTPRTDRCKRCRNRCHRCSVPKCSRRRSSMRLHWRRVERRFPWCRWAGSRSKSRERECIRRCRYGRSGWCRKECTPPPAAVRR